MAFLTLTRAEGDQIEQRIEKIGVGPAYLCLGLKRERKKDQL